MPPAYSEIVDFIAVGTTPESVATFEASPATKELVLDLIEREKRGELTAAERVELEHVMRLAKARARMFCET